MTVTTAPTLQLLDVDPRKLQVNPANVRKKTKNLDELAASIKAIGVQQPLIVRTNGTSDTYVIVAGERRALAAVKAGATTVPVIVRGFDDDGQAELTAMMVENLHREDLTAADEAAGFEQLAAFGMSIDDIVKLTGRDKTRVATGLTVARSDVSAAVTAKYDLNLEQAAAIAEFDTDRNVVKDLTFAAQKTPEQFPHILERARQERERLAARAAKCAELQSAGVKILPADQHLGWALNAKAGIHLSSIVDAKGKAITAANHKGCPGHVAEVDRWGRTVEYGCSDPSKNGHKAKRGTTSTTSKSTRTPQKTAAEKEKEAKAKLQAEQDVKDLEASTIVRRKFVRDLLARKTPPKGLLAFLVPAIIEYELYPNDAKLVEDLTGAKVLPPKRSVTDALIELCKGASDARRQVVLFGFAACTFESQWDPYLLTPKTWQSNTGEASYLQYLASCGYGLSEIEQRIVTVAFPPAKTSRAKKTTSS